MLRRMGTGAALLLAALSGRAQAALENGCALSIDTLQPQWQIPGADVFAIDAAQGDFDLQLVNSGAAPCQVRLGIDLQGAPFGLALPSGSSRVAYAVTDSSSGADLTPRNGKSPLTGNRTVVVPPNSQTLTRFDILVAPQFRTDGLYAQTLFIQATDPTSNEVLAERPVTLVAQAVSSATMALSGNFTRVGGMADVDLGELHQGAVQVPLVMHIKSSRAYSIRSSSENGGKLVLLGTSWSIPYELTMDGQTVHPSGGTYFSTPGNTRRVDNMKLGFFITGNTDVAAGRYSDIVTLEIAVN